MEHVQFQSSRKSASDSKIRCSEWSMYSFNSITVQLRLFRSQQTRQSLHRFNSITVQLRLKNADGDTQKLGRFNSITVQLRPSA